jgi:hypothetical protein
LSTEPLYLTIDIDWAHDTVIADTLALVASAGLAATWFVTHDTPVLADIRATPRQELGLHPNFNPLLEGSAGSARETLLRLCDVVPDATSIRSHSLVRSSRLSVLFREIGITHESNDFLPPSVGSSLSPWIDFTGLIRVPIRWEDDVRLLDPTIGEPAAHLGQVTPLTVDFHPIHLFLNTTSIAEYENARAVAQDPAALAERRRVRGSGGSRDRLLALLEAARNSGTTGDCLRTLRPKQGE